MHITMQNQRNKFQGYSSNWGTSWALIHKNLGSLSGEQACPIKYRQKVHVNSLKTIYFNNNDIENNIDIGCTDNVSSRFILLRGSSGFYSYAIYEHLQDWPAFNLAETRIAFKLRKDKYTIPFIISSIFFYYEINCPFFIITLELSWVWVRSRIMPN